MWLVYRHTVVMLYDPDLIVTPTNRHLVLAALIAQGNDPQTMVDMTGVQLANAYHAARPSDTPEYIRRIGAQIVLDVMKAFPKGAPGAARPAPPPTDFAKHYRTDLVIQIARLGHPILMVGPAGCGKTTIGEHAASALQLPFYITSTINDTHELLGFVDGHGKYHDTPFRHAFEHGGLWIADEIDAWDATALLAANSALANGYANFPDKPERILRHPDFRLVATANTFGTGADRVYVGRNELDAASLDRFAVIEVDYDLTLERMFARGSDRWLDHVWQTRKTVQDKRIRHVVSSRAVGMGSAALADGVEWDQVCESYLLKGMSAKDRAKL